MILFLSFIDFYLGYFFLTWFYPLLFEVMYSDITLFVLTPPPQTS